MLELLPAIKQEAPATLVITDKLLGKIRPEYHLSHKQGTTEKSPTDSCKFGRHTQPPRKLLQVCNDVHREREHELMNSLTVLTSMARTYSKPDAVLGHLQRVRYHYAGDLTTCCKAFAVCTI